MSEQSPSSENRAYAAAHFGLELGEEKDIGLLRSLEGGSVTAEVMTYQFGEQYDVWRQLGKPKYEDIKLQVGMQMSEMFYTWMSDFFGGNGSRKSGAIVAADFWYMERARREFSDALLTEITIPKFDGGDKGAAYMNVTMSPEKVKFLPGNQRILQYAADLKRAKLWTSCNFALTIDGFGDTMARVSKVDSFTVKQKVIEYHMGERREPIKVPGRVEYPNITFYVPEADALALTNEFMKRADGGLASAGINGALTTHDNGNTTLITVHFFGLHLKSATPDKSDSTSEDIKQVKFEMGVERMSFDKLSPE